MWNTTIVYSMFANTIFSPQGDHMEIFRMFPVDGRTDRAVMETSLYIPKPVETPDEKRHWDANLALAIKVITTEESYDFVHMTVLNQLTDSRAAHSGAID